MTIKYLAIISVVLLASCGENKQTANEKTEITTDTNIAVTNTHMHKDVVIGEKSANQLKGITGKEAAEFAVKRLEEKGVKNVQVCVVKWITAPLGGYLVDAKGIWNDKDEEYSTFRIGVRDGSEESENKYVAGEEFAFIAMGTNKAGEKIWYPDQDDKNFEGAYEFLSSSEKQEFENLNSRFKY